MEAALQQTTVHQPCQQPRQRQDLAAAVDVHRGDHGGLQRLAKQPTRGQQEAAQHGQGAVLGRSGLPHRIAPAQHLGERTQLGIFGVLGGNHLVGVRLIGQIVKGQRIGGKTGIAQVQRLFQQLAHPRQLLGGGIAANAVGKAHDLDPQHRMGEQRHHVGPQVGLLQMRQVFRRGVPADLVGNLVQHRLGQVFHPRVAVHDGIVAAPALRAEGQTQAAVGDHHAGGAVAGGLGQMRRELQFQIVMGMDVEQARHQPLAAGVDLACAADLFERRGAPDDLAIGDRHILAQRLRAAVENLGVANDHVIGLVHLQSPWRSRSK